MGAVAGYIRVSSTYQRDQTDSSANQRQRLEQAGATLFFEDLAVSGYKEERRRSADGWLALKKAIERGEISKLLATRLDRYARRDRLVLDLADHCERHNVEFVTLSSGQIDTKSASGWLSVKMQLIVAEHYSRQLSENIQKAYAAAWARGKPARGPLPFHLQRDSEAPAREHRLIRSASWDDARKAVDMYLAGATTVEVCAFLRNNGHRIRTRAGLLDWLRNPLLRGHAGVWRSRDLRLLNVAPALISDAEAELIEAKIEANRKAWGQNSIGSGKAVVLGLSRVCSCASCGRVLSQSQHVGRLRADGTRPDPIWRLRCQTDGCSACLKTVRADRLERELLVDWLRPRHELVVAGLLGEKRSAISKKVETPEILAVREELKLRRRLPEQFRQAGDRQIIADLEAQLASMVDVASAPRAFSFWSNLQRSLIRSGAWLEIKTDQQRNDFWRSVTDSVRVDLSNKVVADVVWRI